jgi:cation diffusion facilitator CzcD-associated flavoprotein CzcO
MANPGTQQPGGGYKALKIIIIGGGPAGLVTLKYLATAHQYFTGIPPIQVELLEQDGDIGGVYHQRVWNEAEVRDCGDVNLRDPP